MDNSGNTELNYCYKCMTRLESGQTVCPSCGHDNTRHQNTENALPEGTILAGKYLVGCVLGQGGFGITYLGFDTALNIKVAIKEYFPAGISTRSPYSIRVTAISAQVQEESFRKGCDEFQEEARRLAAIDSPYIVKVRDYFRENGTAYIIMNYLEGKSLTKEVAECGGKIPWQRVVELFKPLILEMDKLHEDHLIHRDIKPDNIKVIKDKKGTEHLVLLDFGAARSFVSAEATGTYSAMVTQGYAPVEQYSRKAHQGPYTDIYALCATMYAAITGTRPPQSNDRMMGLAELSSFSELGIDVPEPIERAIFHGLEVRSEDRPQSMKELYDELEGKKTAVRGDGTVPVEKPVAEPKTEEKPAAKPEPKKKVSWLVPVLLAVLAAAGFFLYRGIRQSQQDTAAAQTSIAETSAQIVLELAARSTQDVQNTQAVMTEQAEAAGTQTARETQDAVSVQQTGTAWNLTAAAEYQQTQTQEAIEAGATQAEQESRAEQTVQVETQSALNTAAALQSEQTATAWFTTQEAQLHQTQTREAEYLRGTQDFFAMQTETQTVLAGMQTEMAAAEQTMAAQQTATRSAEELGLTQTVSAERTAVYEQTAGALEQTQAALEQREAAFHVMETEAAFAETQVAIDMRMTGVAATKTKAAEPTLTPTPEATATATATLTPTMTNTPEPTATPTKKPLRVGDIITLGQYEQDGNLNNGAEAIEWQVLAVEEGRALVISKYGLDAKPYNEKRTSVTWETCTLRTWLNGEFYNSAFSEEEKVQIQEVRVKNPKNPTYRTKGGDNTTDRIFLLSIEEAIRYFADNEGRKCQPTTYAKNNGAYLSESAGGMTWWWLRSPGADGNYAAVITTDLDVYTPGRNVNYTAGSVRPAFWLNL